MSAPRPSGYSGTPLAKKLGIVEGYQLAIIDGPEHFPDLLEPMPAEVTLRTTARGKADVAVFFTTRRADLRRRLSSLARLIFPDGGLWIAWPKSASRVETDMSEDAVRELALPKGLVDNKVCAIDETWSGLRIVHRVENRGRS